MTSAGDPRRVVLIGPECTGKTTLAINLAGHYGVPCSAEFARTFVDQHPRPVEYEDVDAIGRGQLDAEDHAIAEARARGCALVIHDTDLISTVVYSGHYYGDCPTWISDLVVTRVADLYLLHDIDVPWVEDGHQRIQPERRADLLGVFASTLAMLGAVTVRIAGDWESRRAQALAAIDERLRQA